jgi:integrase
LYFNCRGFAGIVSPFAADFPTCRNACAKAELQACPRGRLVATIAANIGIKAHAHMLRHACGYKLANDGHDTRSLQAYLGHRNIQNTTRYTALAPDRFKSFWKD